MRFGVSLLAALPAIACTCAPVQTPCDGGLAYPVIFVGRVLLGTGPESDARPARVEVREVLRGLTADRKAMVVHGGSCHNRLVAGQDYVIFATPGDKYGEAVIHPCGPTFSLAGATPVLAALRASLRPGGDRRERGSGSRGPLTPNVCQFALPAARSNAEVRGSVLSSEGRPVSGLALRLIRAEDGVFVGSTVTGQRGRYAFRGLPPGEYAITALASDGIETAPLTNVVAASDRTANVNPTLPSPGEQAILEIVPVNLAGQRLAGPVTIRVRDSKGHLQMTLQRYAKSSGEGIQILAPQSEFFSVEAALDCEGEPGTRLEHQYWARTGQIPEKNRPVRLMGRSDSVTLGPQGLRVRITMVPHEAPVSVYNRKLPAKSEP